MAARKPKRYEPVRITTVWLRSCWASSVDAFEAPPAQSHITRPEPPPAATLVATLFLPLTMLEPQNAKRHAPKWVLRRKFEDLKTTFGVQTRFKDYRHIRPLEGRPTVLCTRFSSVEPDKYSDGFKWAVDALCVPAGRRTWGLGYLRDDRPKDAEIVQWWEPAPQRGGFGMIRVFSDANGGQRRA